MNTIIKPINEDIKSQYFRYILLITYILVSDNIIIHKYIQTIFLLLIQYYKIIVIHHYFIFVLIFIYDHIVNPR